MALVMLPSDLPWWDSVKKQLKNISETKNTLEIVESMQKIYEMCNVSLDPEDDEVDPRQFTNLLNFLDNDMTCEDRSIFLNKTLPNITKRALMIKQLRPKRGLHFSLQQQPDTREIDYAFLASLLANAFFSTFPKRTDKTHPTLQNFNFANFFKTLQNNNVQKSKLRSFFHYFDWLEDGDHCEGNLRIFRQVMSSKEWLTIEDWLECNLPLCPFQIRHDNRIERSETDTLQICFSNVKIGGKVLANGCNQESTCFFTCPEMLTLLLNVEALEDNEVVVVENVRQVTRINDPKYRATLEKLEPSREISICCMDAEDFTKLPIGQYEEDNILRELNKCLLAFQQKHHHSATETHSSINATSYSQRHRRLSPIGESTGSNQSEGHSTAKIPLITQQTCSTTRTDSIISENDDDPNEKLKKVHARLEVEKKYTNRERFNQDYNHDSDELVINRRGRFIVLGSSGECLPITRNSGLKAQQPSVYSSLNSSSSSSSSPSSSDEDFHSAKSSFDDGISEDENYQKRYSLDLETPERRLTFARRLREALRKDEAEADEDLSLSIPASSNSEESSSCNYAVGISIAGSGLTDCDIKVRRGGSTGFALHEDSLDEDFLKNSLYKEREWIDKFKNKQSTLSKKESHRSSEYSFSTENSSELEEVYEQFSHWLENPIIETETGKRKELDARDLAVVKFAGSILKRTLSESFAGIPVPLTEGSIPVTENVANVSTTKNKLILSAKSLSLELARQKHRLAAQLSENDFSNSKKKSNESKTLIKGKTRWYITCITEAIVQTLEDIKFNAYLPLESKVSELSEKSKNNGIRPISTGNWGCGSSRKGDVQLKTIIQWMAASVAGAPALIYHTNKHQQLAKLDTLCRLLIDRKWTVKELAEATLRYSNHVLRGKELSGTLFEELIGGDKNYN